MACKYTYKGKEYTYEGLSEILDKDTRFSDLTPVQYSSEQVSGKATSLKAKLRVSPNIPMEIQNSIVDSISFMLLTNPVDSQANNKSSVNLQLKTKLANQLDLIDRAPASVVGTDSYNNLVYSSNILKEVVANFDRLAQLSEDQIKKIGFRKQDNDYYENLEDVIISEDSENPDVVHYRDDANRTRDAKDFIPAEVKQLMYFIPEYRRVNPNNKADSNLIKKGLSWTPVNNVIGLPIFNKFGDTWTKVLTILSDHHLESTPRGLEKVFTILKDSKNPMVVQELAKKLEIASRDSNKRLQIQKAFFVKTNLQKQDSVTVTTNLKKGKQDKVFLTTGNVTLTKVINELQQDFFNTPNLVNQQVDELGREILTINKVRGIELYEKAKEDFNNNDLRIRNYKGTPTGVFTDEGIKSFYNLFKDAGLNITEEGFTNYVKSRTVKGRAIQSNNINDLINTYLKRLSGGFDENQLNPFESERAIIRSVARYDLPFRNLQQVDAYRFDGKSYYPFIKKNYLSDIYSRVKDSIRKIQKNLPNHISKVLKNDIFAKRSEILNSLNSGSNTFVDLFNHQYELGTSVDGFITQTKLLKDMTPSEHLITQYAYFQNAGNNKAIYLYDTLSDKTTMPLVDLDRLNVRFEGSVTLGNIRLDNNTLNTLYNYFLSEYDRIQLVQEQNISLENSLKKEGYHDIGTKEGMGKKFLIYHFLNEEILRNDAQSDSQAEALYEALYPEGNLNLNLNSTAIDLIKTRINNHFVEVIKRNKQDLLDKRVIQQTLNNQGQINNINSSLLFNTQYKSIRSRDLAGTLDGLNNTQKEDYLIDDLVVNYVIGNTRKTVELLYLTGDPAQTGKLGNKKTKSLLRQQYKNDPDRLDAELLLVDIKETLTNLSKRNASLLASGELGSFNESSYNVAFASDIAINSHQLDEYVAMFPDKKGLVESSYGDGDLTDAQELVTVKEALRVQEAYGKITQQQYKVGLYKFDRDQFNKDFPGETVSKKEVDNLNIILQPEKPVQRLNTINPDLSISEQFYLKTSSYPIIPSFVKGTPWEALLNDMKSKGVDRLLFKSGVKQGASGVKSVFNKDGQYNSNLFNDNIHTLDRDGFRIQLEVPYKATKQKITEGSQQATMLFVDVNDDLPLVFKGKKVKAGTLKQQYVDYHKGIVEIQKNIFLDEIQATQQSDGSYIINDLQALSELLIDEGLGRDYPLNSLLGLDLNQEGKFKTPLTFIAESGKIEPVITAILSNRMSRLKLPGYSYVQGSETILHTGKENPIRGIDSIEQSEIDPRSIVWTNPKYVGLGKLSYLRDSNNSDQLAYAQILTTPYWVQNGKRIDIRQYTTTTENGNTVLDLSKIDPELLEINGFRIPFQGHNSGMWMEIVGFLPEENGDLVLVPGEIAAQMGSDYDVDKLYSYQFNYHLTEDNSIRKINDNTSYSDLPLDSKYSFVRSIYDRRINQGEVESEIAQNKLINSLFEEFDEALPTDSEQLKEDLFNRILEELDLTEDQIRSISERELEIKKLENNIIEIHKSIYSNPQLKESILNPLSFDVFQQAIEETKQFQPSESTLFFGGVADPMYQTDIYFSNRMGQLGTALAALANTFHVTAQTANLFIKGEGIKISLGGELYGDVSSETDTNRTNKFNKDQYDYKVKDIFVSNNDPENGAWRLDKIYTFPDKEGRVYKISDLISQILGVSVDNAKEQLLGQYGINSHNFNVVLYMVLSGFDLATVKKFITQPILREYYEVMEDMDNIYSTELIPNKKLEYTRRLFQKYNGLSILTRPITTTNSIENMESALIQGEITDTNRISQLELLDAFLKYSTTADSIGAINRTFNIGTKGLPKNITDTIKKRNDLESIAGSSNIGNVYNIFSKTIPGVFNELPKLATDLFTNSSNPLFLYDTPAYREIQSALLNLTGKNMLFQRDIESLQQSLKSFIYSQFNFGENSSNLVQSLVLGDNNLSHRLDNLKEKYPRNIFLRSINKVVSEVVSDARLLEIPLTNESDYVQKISDAWESAINSTDPQLKSFAEDLVKYSLLLSNKEYGPSNLIKYIPFEYKENIGFLDHLQDVNSQFDINSEGFVKEFVQHNIDFTRSVKDNMIVQGSTNRERVGDAAYITSFKLPDPSNEGAPSFNLSIPSEEGMHYPVFINRYSLFLNKKLLYQRIDDTTFVLIPTKGNQYINEYGVYNVEGGSLLLTNKIPEYNTTNSVAIIENITSEGSVPRNTTRTTREHIENAQSLQDIFTGVRNNLTNFINNNTKNAKQSNLAKYYRDLLDKINELNNDVTIVIDNDTSYNASTTTDGSKIVLNLNRIAKDKRTSLTGDLNLTRILLHEMLHSVSNRRMSQGKSLESVQQVWNEYRKLIWDKGKTNKVRNIPLNVFDAEITKVLLNNFGKKDQMKDINLGNIIAKFDEYQNDPQGLDTLLERVLKDIEASMKQLLKEGSIPEGNYDFTSSPSRVQDFKNHLLNEYIPNLSSNINKYYSYSDIREFMSEAVTNPETMQYINENPSLLKKIKDTIIKYIKQALGLTDERTLLDDSIEAVLGYINNNDIPSYPIEREFTPRNLRRTQEQADTLEVMRAKVLQRILDASTLEDLNRIRDNVPNTIVFSNSQIDQINNKIKDLKRNPQSDNIQMDFGVVEEVTEEFTQNQQYVDLEGNRVSADNIISYETEFGQVQYIKNGVGDLVMIKPLNDVSLQEDIDISDYIESDSNLSTEDFKCT